MILGQAPPRGRGPAPSHRSGHTRRRFEEISPRQPWPGRAYFRLGRKVGFRAGVPRSTAMKMVGHKTESVYRRYAIVDDGDAQEKAPRRPLGTGKRVRVEVNCPTKFSGLPNFLTPGTVGFRAVVALQVSRPCPGPAWESPCAPGGSRDAPRPAAASGLTARATALYQLARLLARHAEPGLCSGHGCPPRLVVGPSPPLAQRGPVLPEEALAMFRAGDGSAVRRGRASSRRLSVRRRRSRPRPARGATSRGSAEELGCLLQRMILTAPAPWTSRSRTTISLCS